MKYRLSVAFIFIFLNCLGATNEPLFVLIEKDPWAMVRGADSPCFALYEDGTIIFSKKEAERQYAYYSCKVDSPEQLLTQFTPITKNSLSNDYRLSWSTDQKTTLFLWRDKKISVYGEMRNPPQKHNGESDKSYDQKLKDWEACPTEIIEIAQKVMSFNCPDAEKWLPEKIEVMVWPYENALEESIVWPKEWPDLEDQNTKKRGKESYSIYLPSAHYEELLAFLKTRNKKGAVLINGHKMSVSVRFRFPYEEKWMQKDPHL